MKNLRKLINLNIFVIGIISVGFIFSSCNNDDDDVESINNGNESINIVEVLSTFDNTINGSSSVNPSFRTLKAALELSGLAGVVSSTQLTLFAPTDAAFAELGITPNNVASVPNLQEILLYHVLEGMVYSNQLSNTYVSTLNGAAVEISIENGAMINDAQVTRADIRALNGVIHAIDQVMLPPTMNLVELALSFDPEFSLLVAAVIRAELTDVLASDGPFTVFAPTNDAFAALLDELPYDGIDEIPVDLLTQVLLYHVVEGRVYSSDLSSGEVNTLNGSFDLNLNTLTITDANEREISLVASLLNVQATNGVVHVIDRVMLP